MTGRTGRAAIAFLLALLAVLPYASSAQAPTPLWLPGFPMRAGTSVILMWTPVPGATGYRLRKKSGDGEFKEVYKGAANMFTDPDVPFSATVVYRVTAVAEGGESPPSSPGTLKGATPLNAPVITGALSSADSIVIRWSSPPGKAFSKVFRAGQESGPYVLISSVRVDTYTDDKVEKGKLYFYKVAAVDEWNRESPKSAVVEGQLEVRARAGADEKPVVRRVVPRGEFFGAEKNRLDQPGEIGFGRDGELYVVDRRSIHCFDPDGKFLRSLKFDRKWSLPAGVTLDRDGFFLVAFYAERLIRKIDPEGKAVAEIRYPPYRDDGLRWAEGAPDNTGRRGESPAAPGAEVPLKEIPNNPNGIAVDGDGNYWIADGVRSQVVKIDRDGKELAVIGRPAGTYDRRKMVESDLPAVRRIWFSPASGKLYALLGVTAQIKVIDPRTAKVLRTVGGLGVSNNRFQTIGGLAFRENGNMLVLDTLTRTVKEFDANSDYVATYADLVERDTVRLSSNLATNIAYNGALKRFYLTSTMGHRVYRFDLPE